MLREMFLIGSIIYTNLYISECDVRIINEKNLTYTDSNKLYLDVFKINQINKENQTFILKTNQQLVYIKDSVELKLKPGWRLIGHTGIETVIKESDSTTSAIKIKDAANIQVKNFHLKMDKYIPAREKSLIEIDNENVAGSIDIVNMNLSNHYSGIWVKRGENIRIDSCLIFDNGHQINLGLIPRDTSQICNYKVHEVTISNSQIRDSKDGDVCGIKTLSNCTGIKIVNNLIANNNQDGIDLFPGGLDVEIRGNTIRDNKIHGIEVKMTKEYPPHQTGKIIHVIIDSNKIINNKNNGITCLDPDTSYFYYARGISITKNQIDSSGFYGIFSQLPVTINNNILSNNGLKPNVYTLQIPLKGYNGIYLLGGRSNDTSNVLYNSIIDQAPIKKIKLIYYMVVNGAKAITNIKDNSLFVTENHNPSIEKYGIGIINCYNYVDGNYVRENNLFSDGFKRNVVVQ